MNLESEKKQINQIQNQDTYNLIKRISKSKTKFKGKESKESRSQLMENVKDKLKEEELKAILLDNELEYYSMIKKEEFGMIDEVISHELFNKYQLEEFNGCLIYIIVLFSSILYYYLHYHRPTAQTIYSGIFNYVHVLNLCTIFNGCSLISTILRYHIILQYLKCNNKVLSNSNLFNSGFFSQFVFDVILILCSPNIYYNNIILTTSSGFNEYIIQVELNYIFIIIMFFRSYRILILFLTYTDYYNFRAVRISYMMGNKINILFPLKCLLYQHPKKTIIAIIFFIVVIFSFLLIIFEGPAFSLAKLNNPSTLNDLSSYGNCVWYLLVTITTIGFGDYYAATNIGRLLTVVVALLGNIVISLLIYLTQVGFTLTSIEQKVYNFSTRLDSKSKLDKVSAAYFKTTVRLVLAKNKLVDFLKNNPIDLMYVDDNDPDYSEVKIKANIKKLNELKSIYYEKIYDNIYHKRIFKAYFQHFRNKYDTFNINSDIFIKLKDIDKKVDQLTEILEGSTLINQQRKFEELTLDEIKLSQKLILHKKKISDLHNRRQNRIFSFKKIHSNKTSTHSLMFNNHFSKKHEMSKKKISTHKKSSMNSNLAYFRNLQNKIEEIYPVESKFKQEKDKSLNDNEEKNYYNISYLSDSADSPDVSRRKSPAKEVNHVNLISTFKEDTIDNDAIHLNAPYINSEIKEENESLHTSK